MDSVYATHKRDSIKVLKDCHLCGGTGQLILHNGGYFPLESAPAAQLRIDGMMQCPVCQMEYNAEHGAKCDDCGKHYEDFGLDTLLPDEHWHMIQGNDDGLLCANCIVRRAKRLGGIVCARMQFSFADEW